MPGYDVDRRVCTDEVLEVESGPVCRGAEPRFTQPRGNQDAQDQLRRAATERQETSRPATSNAPSSGSGQDAREVAGRVFTVAGTASSADTVRTTVRGRPATTARGLPTSSVGNAVGVVASVGNGALAAEDIYDNGLNLQNGADLVMSGVGVCASTPSPAQPFCATADLAYSATSLLDESVEALTGESLSSRVGGALYEANNDTGLPREDRPANMDAGSGDVRLLPLREQDDPAMLDAQSNCRLDEYYRREDYDCNDLDTLDRYMVSGEDYREGSR